MVRETILVVEVDERVRRLTVKRLELIGYRVLEASDGPMALEILRGSDAVDLAFTDLIMAGGLSGREVARRVREIRRITAGYISQFLRVIPRVPAIDVVAEPLIARGEAKAAARDRATRGCATRGCAARDHDRGGRFRRWRHYGR